MASMHTPTPPGAANGNAPIRFRNGENPDPLRLSDSERRVLLSAIEFVRSRLNRAEAGFRTLPEYVGWVRGEIKEVLSAPDEANRREEIGDVLMVSFRLSCHLKPSRSSEEILAIYEQHPTFLRYVRTLGFEGLSAMEAKFRRRYAFLEDPDFSEKIFGSGEGAWKWQHELVRRAYAAEKSKEPEKNPGGEDVPENEDERGEWLCRFVGESAARSGEWQNFLSALSESGRLRNERFLRMVALERAASRNAASALVRIALLLGTDTERAAALRFGLPEASWEFTESFLEESENDPSAALHYREAFDGYRLFREYGFSERDAFEHGFGLLLSWRIFSEVSAPYDFFDSIESIRRSLAERGETAEDRDATFVQIQAALHAYRKNVGTYARNDAFGSSVLAYHRTFRPEERIAA